MDRTTSFLSQPARRVTHLYSLPNMLALRLREPCLLLGLLTGMALWWNPEALGCHFFVDHGQWAMCLQDMGSMNSLSEEPGRSIYLSTGPGTVHVARSVWQGVS